jgi:uncharacterized protein (DUF4415 family)
MASNDMTFWTTIQSTFVNLAIERPGEKRRKTYETSSHNGKRFTAEEIKIFSDVLDSFQASPERFQPEINLMFGHVSSYEEALKDAIKSILLLKSALIVLSKVNDNILDTLLMEPELRHFVYQRLIGTHINLCHCNKMIRMLGDGLINKNRRPVLQVYAFVDVVSKSTLLGLPHIIIDKLKEIPVQGRNRKFLEWKLLLKASTIKKMRAGKFKDSVPECWFSHGALLSSLQSRIKLALGPFLEAEEKTGDVEQFDSLGRELENILLAKPLRQNATLQEAKQYFRELSEKDFPRIVKKNPMFKEFANLNEGEMDILLRANFDNLDRDSQEPVIVDFDLAGVKGNVVGQSKKAKRRRAKLARLAAATHSVRAESEISEASPELPADALETQPGHLDIDDKSKGKEEEEPTMPAVKTTESDAADAIAAEWRMIEEEQARTVERYRILKKLRIDHSKLHRRKINVQTESVIPKNKPRIVAFFHTDDLRLIHPQANVVFVNNQLNDTSGLVLNAGRAVVLKWVFNPEVRIDYEAYQFLCQLFGLAPGRNRLTFSDFLRTFRMLNPFKARMMTRKDYARSVFQFEHAIETEDQVFVPPIGGGHPEHLSSDFNHDKIRKFMMNGGAHPYFFQPL